MTRIFVTPNEPGGILSAAVSLIRLAHCLPKQASDGAYILDRGRLIVETSTPQFALFAINRYCGLLAVSEPTSPEQKQPEMKNPEDGTELLKGIGDA